MWSPCPCVTCVWLNTSLSSLSSLSPHCGSAQSSSSPPSRHNSMSALSQTPRGMRDGDQGVIICHLACYRWLPLWFVIGRGGSRDLNTLPWLDVSRHRCYALLYQWHLGQGVESVLITDEVSTWSRVSRRVLLECWALSWDHASWGENWIKMVIYVRISSRPGRWSVTPAQDQISLDPSHHCRCRHHSLA